MYKVYVGRRFVAPAWSISEARSIVSQLRKNGHDAFFQEPPCVGCGD